MNDLSKIWCCIISSLYKYLMKVHLDVCQMFKSNQNHLNYGQVKSLQATRI